MISREKSLEWAKEVGITSPDQYKLSVSHMSITTLEALINRAYAEGARDMRERAANVLGANGWLEQAADVVSELEIE